MNHLENAAPGLSNLLYRLSCKLLIFVLWLLGTLESFWVR